MGKLKQFVDRLLGRAPIARARQSLETFADETHAGYAKAHRVLDDSSARLDRMLTRMELSAIQGRK